MNEIQINESINKLKDINIGRIDNDSPWKNSKLDEVNSILDSIIKSGNASKDKLKEIINILKTESSVSGLDMIVYHNLVHRMHDFENLLSKKDEEEKVLRNVTQYDTNKNKESVESKVYTGLFTMESRIAGAKNTKKLDELRKELININKSEKRLGVVNKINLLQEKINDKYTSLRKPETKKVEEVKKLKESGKPKEEKKQVLTGTGNKNTNGNLAIPENPANTSSTTPIQARNLINEIKSEKKETNEKVFSTKIYFKDGKKYIIGEKGEEREFELNELNPEFKKKSMILSDFSLLLNIINDDKKLKNIYSELGKLIEKGNFEEVENFIKNIIENIYKNSNGAIYPQNIEKNKEIQKIFSLDGEKRHIELLKFLDTNGNSQLVKQDIIERNFEKTKITNDDIEKIRKIILENNEKESLNLILNSNGTDNNYLSKFKYLFKNEDSIKDFIKNVSNADKKGQKIIEQEKNKQGKRVLDKKYEEAIKLDISDAVIKNECMTALLMGDSSYSKTKGYEGNNEELKLLSEIEGLGYFKISRDSEDLAEIIAIEAVAMIAGTLTAGVGEAAIHALAGARYLKRVRDIINAEKKLAKGAKFVGLSISSGTSFYAGYAGAQSLIEGKNMYSWKGAGESIIFMGAFKGLNAVYSKIPGIKINSEIPLSQQKIKLGTQMAIDGTVFSAIGLASEGIILKPDEWTAEEIIQAFAMAIFFRGISQVKGGTEKLFVRKGENGKIEVGSETTGEIKTSKNISDEVMVPEHLLNGGKKEEILTINEKKKEFKKFNNEEINKNKQLSDNDRINEAEKLLGRKLNKEEKQSILDAHNYETENIKDKVVLLKQNFSDKERKILLKSGICGKLEEFKISKENIELEINNTNIELENLNNNKLKLKEENNKYKASGEEYNKALKELEEIKKLYGNKENDNLNSDEKIKYGLHGSAKYGDIISIFEIKVKNLYKIEKEESYKLKTKKINEEILKLEKILENKKIELSDIIKEENLFIDQQNEIKIKLENLRKKEKRPEETEGIKTEENIPETKPIKGDFLKENISNKLSDEISKIKKGGETTDFGEFKISKNENNEFLLEDKTGTTKFQKKVDLIDYINDNILNNSNSRFSFLNKNLDINFKKTIKNEINIGDETFRINEKGEIETKGKYNDWKKLERDLTDEEMDIIGKKLFGYEYFVNFKKYSEKINNYNFNDVKNIFSKIKNSDIGLWKIASKELNKGGFHTIYEIPVNLIRMPTINIRKLYNVYESNKNIPRKLFEALGILTIPGQLMGRGLLNFLRTSGAMGFIALITYKETLAANPQTNRDLIWKFTLEYLKTINIDTPIRIYDFSKEHISDFLAKPINTEKSKLK